ncbi:MAG: hypothetical protein K2X87_18210 [Gemmataceae bacterium]|nr:hypothetical protein [Gemmataceae bacterium]
MAAPTTMSVTPTLPRNAPLPPVRSRPAAAPTGGDPVAKFLGYFSLGLGAAEVLAPRLLGRLIGVGHHPTAMPLFGLREIAAGVGILATGRKAEFLAARVAGDALDLAALFAAWMDASESDRRRIVSAGIAVAGVTAVDIACAAAHARDRM